MKFKFLFCLLFLCGCAYYNIFYNAKDCYKQAMVSTPPNQGLLEKSIQKCEKMIDSYPNSKWVPEALLLMGRCFMEKGDYDPAIRKFKELIEYYPKHKLIDDAQIELARAYLKKGDYIEAKNVIKKVKKERMQEINILMVETYFMAQAYDTTIKIAKANLPNIRNSTLKSRTYTLIANSYDSLGKYKSAIKYYNKAFKLETKNLPVVLAIANASLKLNNPEQALDKLTRYNEVMTAAEQDTLTLMIAKSYRAKKDFTKAIETLDKIKTSPQASYDMGVIYEEDLQNLEKAKECYEQVRNAGSSEISNNALVRAVRIDKLIGYQQIIAKKSAADSLSKQTPDTLKKETSKDSLSKQNIDTLKIKTPKDSLSKKSIDTLKIKTSKDSLSEQNPNIPKTTIDSAKLFDPKMKKDILPMPPRPGDRRPTVGRDEFYGRMPPKDSLNTDIPGMGDSLLDTKRRAVAEDTLLTKTLPDSSKDTLKPEDLGKAQFLLAELFLFEFKKIDGAIQEYEKVITDYPESEYAPKAAYSIGWVIESEKKDTTGAISAYKRVETNFKNNKYSPKYIESAKKAILRLTSKPPKNNDNPKK